MKRVLLWVLLVALIGGAGFGGWKYLQRNHTGKNTNNSQTNQNTIPTGWIQYKNNEIGFSFYYPPEWGDVKLADSKLGDERIFLEFTEQTSVTIKINSNNRGQSGTDDITSNAKALRLINNEFYLETTEGLGGKLDKKDVFLSDNNSDSNICFIERVDVSTIVLTSPENKFQNIGYCKLDDQIYSIFIIQSSQFENEIITLLRSFRNL